MSTLNERTSMLLEIFYGLAIASGLEQVAPRIFGYDGMQVRTPEWWYLLAASCLALAIAVGDWVAFNLQSHDYTRPLRLLLDVLFPAIIFVFFAGSHIPWFFLLLVAVYSILAIVHWLVLTADRGQPYNALWFIGVRAVILAAAAGVTFYHWLKDSPRYTTTAWVATLLVVAYTVWSWVKIWKKLGRDLSPAEATDGSSGLFL
jgi:hypothetical protein